MTKRSTVLARNAGSLAAATAIAISGLVVSAESSDAAEPRSATTAVCKEPVTRYGYTGYKKCGSAGHVGMEGPAGREYFVIAPSRRIYHIWPGSRGWRVMPNDGRADDIYAATRCTNGSLRKLTVTVYNGYRWTTHQRRGSNSWSQWTRGYGPGC